MNLTDLTITQVHQGLAKKEFSVLELCQAYLERIKNRDKEISAFLTVNEDLALSQAKKIDDLIYVGKKIPVLAGVPCAIKDNILVEEIRCTAASKILENYIASYDATVIKRLKEQGAVFLGKTNMDEFAMGSSTENSAFGPTKNPRDLSRVPGGSSGGSAAAVAGNLCCYALGSDTGGSIRLPASFCGAVGLKPTYGAVSRYGLIAFASSLDQIGPITKTAEDAKIVFDVISGKDKMDSTSVNPKSDPSTSSGSSRAKSRDEIRNPKQIQNLRIGVPREYFVKGIDPEVEKVIKGAIKKYEEMGAKIEEVSLPHTEYALSCYYIIAPSEASANLARYDAIRYGGIPEGPRPFCEKGGAYGAGKNKKLKIKDLFDYYLIAREEGFGAEVRRRIIIGAYTLSAGYYEAYYLKAQKVRTLISDDFEKVFRKVDVLMTPVSPFLPFKIGEKIEDPLSMYLVDVYTVSVNLAGLPALSLPVGKVGELPVGLQIIGKPFEEQKILNIGKHFKEM